MGHFSDPYRPVQVPGSPVGGKLSGPGEGGPGRKLPGSPTLWHEGCGLDTAFPMSCPGTTGFWEARDGRDGWLGERTESNELTSQTSPCAEPLTIAV